MQKRSFERILNLCATGPDQPTQRALVLLVLLHVGREVGDAHGALCNLYLGRPGVFLMESVPATAQVTCSGDGVVGS